MTTTPHPDYRPRERCLRDGASTLMLRECLALILGSGPPGSGALGLAQKILEKPGTGFASPDEERAFFTAMEVCGNGHLSDIPGLGDAQKARLLATLEIGRRYAIHLQTTTAPKPRKKLPDLVLGAIRRIPLALRLSPQEWLGFVPVHRSGEVGEFCIVEKGARTHVNVDPVELFARLLALRPRAFFLFHNHPSGDLTASPQDAYLTQQISMTSRQFAIEMLGHWIITADYEAMVT